MVVVWLVAVSYLLIANNSTDTDEVAESANQKEEVNESINTNSNDETPAGTLKLTRSRFAVGEKIEFTIDNIEVNYCSNVLPYRITDSQGDVLNIRHSCAGLAGYGIDQYCEDGQVVIQQTDDICSDHISCESQNVSGVFTWDQKTYQAVSDVCGDQQISREEAIQAGAGIYHILITDTDEKVYNETFTISGSQVVTECSENSECNTGGCSGEVCGVKGLVETISSPCVARPYYQCYSLTSCGCINGQCKWESNDNFDKCFEEKMNE
ncbi:eight-cysteine-cluster domain-containing protein [Patescibacteria group bacterium]|nr:eight-cysteine-cluster domain-containing protein [Patescibacteria group bacterium]MBU1890843.1 eight-cysteine-cluster domain-containing protein [Patescibacteria group bacterium]